MSEHPRYKPRTSAIFAELGDGTGVILDLQTKAYFTLNPTGVFVWKTLSAAPAGAEDVAQKLSSAFAVEADRAVGDVEDLLRRLGAEALVESAE